MDYWRGGEIEKSIFSKFNRCALQIDNKVAEVLRTGSLSEEKIELCYIPIVVGSDFKELYPARSRFSLSERRIYHSPVLDFQIVKNGTDAEICREFIRGLLSAMPFLREAGCCEERTTRFENDIRELMAQYQEERTNSR